MTDDPAILDHRCADCDYSLVGLDRDAPCPECGGVRRLHDGRFAIGTPYQRDPRLGTAIATARLLVFRPSEAILEIRNEPLPPKWASVLIAGAILALTTGMPILILAGPAALIPRLWLILLPGAVLLLDRLIDDVRFVCASNIPRDRRVAIRAHIALVAPFYAGSTPLLPIMALPVSEVACLLLGYVLPWITFFMIVLKEDQIFGLSNTRFVVEDPPSDGPDAE